MTGLKLPISPARLAANRANAERSTGPRTEAGKAKSRLNGLKHGLRAESVLLPGEDPEAFQHRLDAWTADFRPAGATERHLLELAVQASWRMDRCLTVETAVLTGQVLHAEDDFDDRLAADAERLIATFEDDPAGAVRQLRQSSPGCRWLIARWEGLADRMRSAPTLELTEKDLALRLLGKRPREMFDDPEVRQWTVAHLAAVMGNTGVVVENVRAILWPDRPEGMHPVEFERRVDGLIADFPATMTARAFLIGEIRRAMVELTDRAELLTEREERDRALARDSAAFDASKAGGARLRYEMAHHRVYRAALRDLAAEQKRRREREDEEPEDSAEAQSPAMPEAPSEPSAPEVRPAVPSAPGEPRATPRLPSAPSEPRDVARPVAVEAERGRPGLGSDRPDAVRATRAA